MSRESLRVGVVPGPAYPQHVGTQVSLVPGDAVGQQRVLTIPSGTLRRLVLSINSFSLAAEAEALATLNSASANAIVLPSSRDDHWLLGANHPITRLAFAGAR